MTRYLMALLGGCALCASLIGWPVAVGAATARVDDTGTRVSTPLVGMRWRQLVPGRGADNTAEGSVQVALRLNVQPWLNQRGRIYMTLAPAARADAIKATWRTQGRLLPGSVQSGGRAVIFDGTIAAASIEETIDLTLSADGRSLVSPQSLQFAFEIETP